jgi:hypothetical protein
MNRRPESNILEPLLGNNRDGSVIFDYSPEYLRGSRMGRFINRLTKIDDTQGIWYVLAFDRQYCMFI